MAAIDPHFRLRIPEDLKARVERSAEENGRSITAEIVFRLRNSFGAEASEADLLDRRIRDISGNLEAARARLEQTKAELSYFGQALHEATSARDEMRELEQRRRHLEGGLAAQRAERA